MNSRPASQRGAAAAAAAAVTAAAAAGIVVFGVGSSSSVSSVSAALAPVATAASAAAGGCPRPRHPSGCARRPPHPFGRAWPALSLRVLGPARSSRGPARRSHYSRVVPPPRPTPGRGVSSRPPPAVAQAGVVRDLPRPAPPCCEEVLPGLFAERNCSIWFRGDEDLLVFSTTW